LKEMQTDGKFKAARLVHWYPRRHVCKRKLRSSGANSAELAKVIVVRCCDLYVGQETEVP
jgi:hypothetical protein